MEAEQKAMKKQRVPHFLVYLLIVFAWFVLVFNIFRWVLLYSNSAKIDSDPTTNVSLSLLYGFRFDVMVVSYLMTPAFLISVIGFYLSKKNKRSKWVETGIKTYLIIINIIIVLAAAADVPYYKYFNSRITKAVWSWVDSPGVMLKFIFTTPAFYPMLIALTAITGVGIFIISKAGKKLGRMERDQPGRSAIAFLVTALLIFWGVRGGSFYRPLSIRDAFLCNNIFVNELAINPLHSYLGSLYTEASKRYTDAEAIAAVKQYYGIMDQYDSPVARKITGDENAPKKNVFLILVESLYYDAAFNREKKLMPFLDSLRNVSRSYENLYSSGIHTHNGLYATLYGFPTLPGTHPFSDNGVARLHYTGLANTLKEYGYATEFYCTHEPEFDNLGFFLKANGFDKLYSRRDYPENKITNGWGISDEYLFEFCLQRTRKLSKENKPFLNVLLTISTHHPPELPKPTAFKTELTDPTEQVYAYSDWCLKNFFDSCSKEPWFQNSIFVILGDHGTTVKGKNQLEMPMSVHHIPLIIYEPGKEAEHKNSSCLGSQMDVFPTLMGALNLPYINNSFGIDLEREQRPYAFFVSDDRLGVVNKNYLFVSRDIGGEALYQLSDTHQHNYIGENKAQAEIMKKYAYTVMQCAAWMLEHGKEKKP